VDRVRHETHPEARRELDAVGRERQPHEALAAPREQRGVEAREAADAQVEEPTHDHHPAVDLLEQRRAARVGVVQADLDVGHHVDGELVGAGQEALERELDRLRGRARRGRDERGERDGAERARGEGRGADGGVGHGEVPRSRDDDAVGRRHG
jgi:hypothetical protein